MRTMMFMSLFCLLFSCNPDKDRKVDAGKSKFTTSDASELFFKNMRQVYYDKSTLEAAKLDVYRSTDRSISSTDTVLNLAIVINWRYDEAYLLVEPSEPLQALDTIKVLWKDKARQQQGYYLYTGGSKEEQFDFAAKLYQGLQQEQQFFLDVQGNLSKFMADRKAREAFRKTVFDYFRLVDLL